MSVFPRCFGCESATLLAGNHSYAFGAPPVPSWTSPLRTWPPRYYKPAWVMPRDNRSSHFYSIFWVSGLRNLIYYIISQPIIEWFDCGLIDTACFGLKKGMISYVAIDLGGSLIDWRALAVSRVKCKNRKYFRKIVPVFWNIRKRKVLRMRMSMTRFWPQNVLPLPRHASGRKIFEAVTGRVTYMYSCLNLWDIVDPTLLWIYCIMRCFWRGSVFDWPQYS